MSKRNVFIISALAGIAVVGAGVGLAVYVKNKKKKQQEDVPNPSGAPCGATEIVAMKINGTPVVSTDGGAIHVDGTARTVSVLIPSMTLSIAKDGDMVMSTTIPDCIMPKTEFSQVLGTDQVDYPLVAAGQACVVAKITPETGGKTRLYFYLSMNDEDGQQNTTGTEGYGTGTWALKTPLTVSWTF
jgi:hypothetical protein